RRGSGQGPRGGGRRQGPPDRGGGSGPRGATGQATGFGRGQRQGGGGGQGRGPGQGGGPSQGRCRGQGGVQGHQGRGQGGPAGQQRRRRRGLTCRHTPTYFLPRWCTAGGAFCCAPLRRGRVSRGPNCSPLTAPAPDSGALPTSPGHSPRPLRATACGPFALAY